MPRYNNPKKTRRYSTEFKIKAVQLSHLDNVHVKVCSKNKGRVKA